MKVDLVRRWVGYTLRLSIIISAVGCTTTREITKLEESEGLSIDVVTKGHNRYRFDKWECGPSGGMQGNEKLCSSDGTSKEEWPTLIHTVAAPKDRLASAKVTVVDAGKTCLVVAGVASGVAVGIVSFKRMKVSFDAYDAAAKPPFPRAPF